MSIGPKNSEKKSLTGGACQGISTGVKPIQHISLKSIVPEKAGQLRSGDARRACIGPHTCPAFSGYFSAQSAGRQV